MTHDNILYIDTHCSCDACFSSLFSSYGKIKEKYEYLQKFEPKPRTNWSLTCSIVACYAVITDCGRNYICTHASRVDNGILENGKVFSDKVKRLNWLVSLMVTFFGEKILGGKYSYNPPKMK